MVLACVVAFFAVIITVNLIMVRLAISTFGGVDTENAYQAGLAFSREIAAARAQEARNWRVDAKISPRGADGVTINLAPKDGAGRPLWDVDLMVALAHPTDRRQDHVASLNKIGPGLYRGDADVPPGQWDLLIEIAKGGERMFRSKNRVNIR
jgi:nitrogen fixation protein FixH